MLVQHAAQIARDYVVQKRDRPNHRFRWPDRNGQSLLAVVRGALIAMTAGHCSYCDGHPLNATGIETVDHFRPKSRPEFYELVCEWTNLFLTCTACNHAKQEQWDDQLLRPDDPGFEFERYFEYRSDTGELHPSGAASFDEQQRARRTIDVFCLNRADACSSRKRVIRFARHGDGDADALPYRYLLPLCRGD